MVRGDRALPRPRVDSAARQRRGHQRQVAAVDLQRALPEIEVEGHVGRLVEDAEVAQHVADRAVAVARLALGAVDGLVEGERSPRIGLEHRDEAAPAIGGAMAGDESRRGDGARVDQGIAGAAAAGLEADLVEGLARRFDADLREHGGLAAIVEGEAVDEGLRDRLDREGLARIADLVELAVDGREADAEPARIGLPELGDVGRHLAVLEREEAPEQRVEMLRDGRTRRVGGVGPHSDGLTQFRCLSRGGPSRR